MQSNLRLLATTAILTLGLIGCDDDENDNELENLAEQLGTVHDARLAGLHVSAGSMPTQTTNDKGEYKYQLSANCAVSISGVFIGETPCRNVVVPRHLIIDGKSCDTKGQYRHCAAQLNFARLAITIDQDNDPDTITLPELNDAGKEMLGNIKFDQGLEAFASSENVKNFIGQYSNTLQLTSPVEAMTHMHSKVGGEHLVDRSFIDHDLIANKYHYLTMMGNDGKRQEFTFEFMRNHKVNVWEGRLNEEEASSSLPEMHDWSIKDHRYLMIGELMVLSLEHRSDEGHMRLSVSKPAEPGNAPVSRLSSVSESDFNISVTYADVDFNKLAGAMTFALNDTYTTITSSTDATLEEFSKDELADKQYWYSFHLFTLPESTDETDTSYLDSAEGIIGAALSLTENEPYMIYYGLNKDSDDAEGPTLSNLSDDCPTYETEITDTSEGSDIDIGIITFPSPQTSIDVCYVSYKTLAYKVIDENCAAAFASNETIKTLFCADDGTGNDNLESYISSAQMTYGVLDTGTLKVDAGGIISFIKRFEDTVEIEPGVNPDDVPTVMGSHICIETDDTVTALADCSTSEGDTNGILLITADNTSSSDAFTAGTALADICIGQLQGADVSADCPLTITE